MLFICLSRMKKFEWNENFELKPDMFAYNILIGHKMIIHIFIIIILIWKKNSNIHKIFHVCIVEGLYIVKGIRI